MGAPTIGGDISGSVTEDSGLPASGDLDDIGFLAGNTDDTWSVTLNGTYGSATIDPTTGTWSYVLNDAHPAVQALGAGDTLTDTFTVLMVDADTRFDTQGVTITINGVPCFCGGTLIETARGPCPVEDIRAKDMVWTLDNGFRPVLWAGYRQMTEADWIAYPKLRPIRISAAALGDGKPAQDLVVSPQHRILIQSRIAERIFGNAQVLLPAVKLLGLPGIERIETPGPLSYHHLLFDQHEIILSNGAATESLFTGKQAMMALGPEARQEIETLFPGLAAGDMPFDPARPFPDRGRQVTRFTERLVKNGKPAIEDACETAALREPALPDCALSDCARFDCALPAHERVSKTNADITGIIRPQNEAS